MVRVIRAEVRDTNDLQPDRATTLLIRLTALYGNVLDEVREAEMAYNSVLLGFLNGDEAANRARIRAQASPEYARAREAKDTERLTLELVRSLKKFIASKQEEMRLSR
jgi:hypothetical protein